MKVMTILGARPETVWPSGAIGLRCMSYPIPDPAHKESQVGRTV